ncbi:MAG TPA: PD-(D/E)XK nuclease family protein [Burkholderiales bacterium]|nr:PD-(D/E)XK nuclease family protein [Burkholderiales bacterium]
MPFASLAKSDLFVRLAAGHAAQVSVVTPNRRLAQELGREFDEGRIAAGLAVWESADIVPFGALVERLYEDALHSERAAGLALLLTPAQERHLWEQAIEESEWGGALLGAAQAAAQAADAWRLAQAWRIDGALGSWPGNDDARAFAGWAQAYARRCARDGHVDAARLPDVVAGLLKEDALRKPKLLVAYAFDILTPQTREFLAACAQHGTEVRLCAPQREQARPRRRVFASARAELEAAAQWARARLEEARARLAPKDGEFPAYPAIGIVVPDLQKRRKEVLRVFARVMDPAGNLPGAGRDAMPFNVSLGAPLTDEPLVHAALGLLALAGGEVEFALASRLVRSPFVRGAQGEMARRARLDAQLRARLPARVTLVRLRAAVEALGGAPLLARSLDALIELAATHRAAQRSPQDWGRHFSALLEAAGFPGERALDSHEFQVRAKFHETLGELARLERVAPRMRQADALARLGRLCRETLFQPESAAAPIQVLGILESASLQFAHLWVSGLTDDAWPLAARPSPLIAVALQKKAGIPEASADTALALDRRITAGWLGAAEEVIVSHALREADRDLAPSALIAQVPEDERRLPAYPRYREAVFALRELETVPDGRAPALPRAAHGARAHGGSRVLADQAACPFRAFARHRLGAGALETPADGPNAADRGRLLHELMKSLWGTLGNSAALRGNVDAAVAEAAHTAVKALRLEGRFAELERERLARLAREWLEVEKTRGEFEVVALEEKRALEIGGLALQGRIDRLDRLPDGSHALVDYKTADRVTPRDWMDARPRDPQLPLYAVTAPEDIGAVAFAKLRHGAMRFTGYARAADALPGVTRFDHWDGLLAGWKAELEALGAGFAAGEARVAPKELLKTCRECDLQPLCRVHERLDALGGDEQEQAE